RVEAKERENLDRDEAALVQRILGEEWIPKANRLPDELESEALVRFVFGPMSEEKVQGVIAVFGKYETLQDEIRERTDRIFTDEDQAELQQLCDRMKQDLRALLAPAELEELLAR